MIAETIANASTGFSGPGPRAGNIDALMATYLQTMQHVPSELHLGAGGLTYTGLRFLARTPQVAAIIRTRVNQVAEFARVASSDFSTGFRIVPTDPTKKISARVEQEIEHVTNLILNGGGMWFIGGFEAFVRAIVTDSLTYDMATFEVVTETDLDGNQWPVAFVPVDPATIRRAVPIEERLTETKRWDFDEIAFVQWLDNEVKAEFTAKELACGVRNPRSWIYAGGYGHPELEQLIFIVSNIINAQASNAANYMTGVHGNTLVELQTKMKDKKFAVTERVIQAALSGPRQNKKTAVVQTNPDNNEAIKIHNLGGESNSDMQYSEWINFLLKTICSLYAIDPAEMGFIFGTENVKNQQYADSPIDPHRVLEGARPPPHHPSAGAVAQLLGHPALLAAPQAGVRRLRCEERERAERLLSEVGDPLGHA